jgi:hypothetical protein
MIKLRSALQKRDLGIRLRAGAYEFNGEIFRLRVTGLRQEDRAMARAAQKPTQRKHLIDDLALEFFPVIPHGTPPTTNASSELEPPELCFVAIS